MIPFPIFPFSLKIAKSGLEPVTFYIDTRNLAN